MQTTHNYTAVPVKEAPQNGLILQKQKHNAICINRQPIITQGNYNKLNIEQLACATHCPFANVSKNDAGEFIYEVSCGKHIKEFTLSNKEELENYFAPKEEAVENKIAGGVIIGM